MISAYRQDRQDKEEKKSNEQVHELANVFLFWNLVLILMALIEKNSCLIFRLADGCLD